MNKKIERTDEEKDQLTNLLIESTIDRGFELIPICKHTQVVLHFHPKGRMSEILLMDDFQNTCDYVRSSNSLLRNQKNVISFL